MGYFERVREPESIILETRGLVADLFEQVPELAGDGDHPLIERTMGCLAYEGKAEFALSELCFELLADVMYVPDLQPQMQDQLVDRNSINANQMYRFGHEMHRLFKQMRLYHNGYLHYQFTGWVGRDMVLTRLLVPRLQDTRSMDTLTDDDLWVPTPMRRAMRR